MGKNSAGFLVLVGIIGVIWLWWYVASTKSNMQKAKDMQEKANELQKRAEQERQKYQELIDDIDEIKKKHDDEYQRQRRYIESEKQQLLEDEQETSEALQEERRRFVIFQHEERKKLEQKNEESQKALQSEAENLRREHSKRLVALLADEKRQNAEIAEKRKELASEIETKRKEWASEVETKRKALESQISAKLEELDKELASKRKKFDAEQKEKIQRLSLQEKGVKELLNEFQIGFLNGRKWLARLIAEAITKRDDKIAKDLITKKRPAPSAAEVVKEVKAEKQRLYEELYFVKYQLESYKEYFPFLDEYEDAILEEAEDIRGETADEVNSGIDPVRKFIPPEEFNKLSSSDRNQLALDRYLQSSLSKYGIGRMYEMYLGYLYSKDDWDVKYFGMLEQRKDMGRDLICKKGKETLIVQAKCWAQDKVIHEKHVFQLFGTTFEYRQNNPSEAVTPVFITTTKLSPVAKNACELLGIEYEEMFPLDKNFPMIKCNISQSGERIYHLPFDQQYNKTVITPETGEFYAMTVKEAESKGFRRAFRYFGQG